MSPIHPGIFLGRAAWADSVFPPVNTIMSRRDQFKPIGIEENLMVNYNGGYCAMAQPIGLQHLH